MATKEKNIWILIIFILAGLVIGGLLGQISSSVSWLWWLRIWGGIWTFFAINP